MRRLAALFMSALVLGFPGSVLAQIQRDSEPLIVIAGVRWVDKQAQPVFLGHDWRGMEDRLVAMLQATPLTLTSNVIHRSDTDLEKVIATRADKVGSTIATVKTEFLSEFDVYALIVFGTFEHTISASYPGFPGTFWRSNYVAGASAVLVDAETGRIVLSASGLAEGATAGEKTEPDAATKAGHLRTMYTTAMEQAVRNLVTLEKNNRINDKGDVRPLAIMGVRTEDHDGTELLSLRPFPARYNSPCDFAARCDGDQCIKMEALIANAAAAQLSAKGRVVVPPFWSDWVHGGQHGAELALSMTFPKENIRISHNLNVRDYVIKSRQKLVVSVKTLNERQQVRPDKQAVDHAYAAWLNIYGFDTEGSCTPIKPPTVFAKFDNQSAGGSKRIQTKVTLGQSWSPTRPERQAYSLGAILDAFHDWK